MGARRARRAGGGGGGGGGAGEGSPPGGGAGGGGGGGGGGGAGGPAGAGGRTGAVLERLEVENFKSYAGKQTVGPFKGFTAIVGPNGSGKSNVMDAISFALGMRSAQLRGAQLADLVHSLDGQRPEAAKASVRVVLRLASGRELRLERSCSVAGGSEYRWDGRVVTWETYSDRLADLGIHTKARNFLVFQGDVESIASRSPRDLTRLIEQVSGSDALREDFERLEAEKKEADEQMSFAFSKRRQIQAERKQKKEQREEAEKYLERQREVKELKSRVHLARLAFRAADIASVRAEEGEAQAKLAEAQGEVKLQQKEVGKVKSEQVKAQKSLSSLGKRIHQKRREADALAPAAVQKKEEISRTVKRIRNAEAKVKQLEAAHREQRAGVERLQAELEGAREEQRAFEAEVAAAEKDDHVKMGGSQISEYNRLKEEASAKTVRLKHETEVLDRKRQAERDNLVNVEETVKELNRRLQQLQAQTGEAKTMQQKLAEALEKHGSERDALKAELAALVAENRAASERRDTLKKQLEVLENKLREAKADISDGQREERMRQTVEALRRRFPGVHGRLIELCKLSSSKYELATTMVLGKNLDAVVVDDVQVAKKCVSHLRENQLSPMTFIPLASVKAPRLDERLRALGGTAVLAYDVVRHDERFERAVRFAVANTVMCDSVEEARALAYDRGERRKVIAVDGTMFGKSGNITGGASTQSDAQSKRWTSQKFSKMKADRNKLLVELDRLPSHHAALTREQEAQKRLDRSEKHVYLLEVEEKMNGEKLQKQGEESDALKEERARRLPELNQGRAKIEEFSKRIDEVEESMNAAVDQIFQDFSASVGVANIREYEENQLRRQQEVAQKRMEFATRAARVKSQLDYEDKRDTEKPFRKVEKALSQDKGKLKELKAEETSLKRKVEAEEQALEGLKRESAGLKARVDELEKQAHDAKAGISGKTAVISKIQRGLSLKASAVEQLQQECEDVLQAAANDMVELPLRAAGGDGPAPMDTAEEGGGPSTSEAEVEVGGKVYDLSGLGREVTGARTQSAREKVESNLQTDIDRLQAELDAEAPNLKAMEQYERVLAKEKEQQAEVDGARRKAEASSLAFMNTRDLRVQRFMDAFETISSNIDPIYKDLTGGGEEGEGFGGTAYLSLENPDEPFSSGLKYSVMPPTKRFREMADLSGGEKTLAALALVFAVHSFRPSPFFVLDEIDAALDNTNVARVAGYLRRHGRAGSEDRFQSLVISLKDIFYDKAEALVGVCRDPDKKCSQALTMDLSAHPEPGMA